jgi:hypothetical protein
MIKRIEKPTARWGLLAYNQELFTGEALDATLPKAIHRWRSSSSMIVAETALSTSCASEKV